MKNFLLGIIALLVMNVGALAQSTSATVHFTAPDGKAYAIPFEKAVKPSGFKLDKLGTEEKRTVNRPVSVQRAVDWTKSWIPGGQDCTMEYLIFAIRTDGGNNVAVLTGAHNKCKQQIAKQGTIVSCPSSPDHVVVAWAGMPQGDALKSCPAN